MNLVTSEQWLAAPPDQRPWKPDGKLTHSALFYSLTDMILACRGEPSIPGSRRESRRERDDNWAGTTTFDEAIEVAEKGWKDGAERITALSASITAEAGMLSPQSYVEYVDADGHALDIERYLTGDPEHWVEIHERFVDNPGGRVFRIVLNTSTSGGVSSTAMMGKGAATAALVAALEERGFPCEVIACSCTGKGKDARWLEGCYVKQAGDPLSILTLAFPLAHPAFERRFDFSFCEQLPPNLWREVQGSYGSPSTVPQGWVGADIIIDRALYGEVQWQNTASAAAWVVKQLRELGIIEGDV